MLSYMDWSVGSQRMAGELRCGWRELFVKAAVQVSEDLIEVAVLLGPAEWLDALDEDFAGGWRVFQK